MKKVLFTATVDSHILHFHLPYLKMFKEHGYEVHVATNGDENIPYCDVKHIVSFERSPLRFNNLKAIRQLKKIINEEKFDIIHTHTPMGSVVTRLAAKKARKKYHTRVIYTAHGLHFFKGAPLKNWLIFYPIEKYLSKYTDTLILINQEDHELCKRKFKKCKDIHCVPGVGIDEEKFNFELTKKESKGLRASLGIKKGDFVMIYPAELSKRKRQIWLINAIKKLLKDHNDIHLLLPGKDSLNGECKKLIDKLNLSEQIHLLGYRNDIPQLLKISDLALSSSSQEGLPVNIMEAMYCGLPIIATDCRGNRDLVKDHINGYLINVNDQKRFAKCIEKVYFSNGNNSKYEKESKYIIKEYLLDKVLVRLNDIYFHKNKKICYLRSTAIYNDSRATKEISSYNTKFNVLVFGWNRLNENINLDNAYYEFFEKKAKFGSGVKNIFNIILFNLWLYKKLVKNLSNYDIIHACDFDTAFTAYIVAKKYNKKIIYDIYDYYTDCHRLGILNNLIKKIDNKIINYSDVTFLCTPQRREQIKPASPNKIEIIHNSPDVIPNKSVRDKDDKINVGYFGVLQDDRLLLEISEKIVNEPNIVFHVGGFGKYDEYFMDLSKKYNNVHYYGKLKYSEVINCEKKCDVLFATYNPQVKNHKYSAPNKVYESMALNLPIIVCEGTGVDDIVKNENIGLVIKYDACEFISVLKNIKNVKFNNCKKIFEKEYRWKIMEDRMIKCIYTLRGDVLSEEDTNN